MVKCSICKKEVNDIRPQIEGVGVCWDCKDKPLPEEIIQKWKEINEAKKK